MIPGYSCRKGSVLGVVSIIILVIVLFLVCGCFILCRELYLLHGIWGTH